jgi:type VI secretion system ImpH/TssG family protein
VGLFHQKPHSASALENLVSDFFEGVLVRIEQCTGQWVTLKPEQQASLGRRSCQLGWDTSIGEKIYSNNSSFRICIGSLRYNRFLEFLPCGANFKWLLYLVKLFIVDRLDFDLELRVFEHEIPLSQLTSKTHGLRLGWTSWLINKPAAESKQAAFGERSVVLRGPRPLTTTI